MEAFCERVRGGCPPAAAALHHSMCRLEPRAKLAEWKVAAHLFHLFMHPCILAHRCKRGQQGQGSSGRPRRAAC